MSRLLPLRSTASLAYLLHRSVVLVILVLSVSSFTPVMAADVPVPAKVQGAIFKKIFGYDKQLPNGQRIVLYIIGGDDEDEATQELIEAFREDAISPLVVDIETLSAPMAPSVVYLMPEADVELARRYCTLHGVLSITGVPKFAERGLASVGLDLDGDRPEIIVNLPRLEAENHSISAEILALSRVVR